MDDGQETRLLLSSLESRGMVTQEQEDHASVLHPLQSPAGQMSHLAAHGTAPESLLPRACYHDCMSLLSLMMTPLKFLSAPHFLQDRSQVTRCSIKGSPRPGPTCLPSIFFCYDRHAIPLPPAPPSHAVAT